MSVVFRRREKRNETFLSIPDARLVFYSHSIVISKIVLRSSYQRKKVSIARNEGSVESHSLLFSRKDPVVLYLLSVFPIARLSRGKRRGILGRLRPSRVAGGIARVERTACPLNQSAASARLR